MTKKAKNISIEEIEDLIACIDEKGKEINNWKFGIELEYGGYSNKLEYDPTDVDNLIETIKHDCSVGGDGTEYNLKPISFEDFRTNKRLVKLFESFCYRAANKNCTISRTAGMHIHFSWDKEFDTEDGKIMGRILQNSAYDLFGICKEIKEPRSYLRSVVTLPVEEIKWKEETKDWEKERIKKLYEAFQFIYSVSNRDGTEAYGLGTGYTRGYSHHKTLELRCWRTSYDYREIIARVFVARFFLQYILKIGLLKENELYDEIIKMESIWDLINKEENAKLKSMYEYLAYNSSNKHRMGLPIHILMAKLRTYDMGYTREIKRRSDVYNKSLKKNTNAKKAKEIFETIINFEDKGEQDESRIQNN